MFLERWFVDALGTYLIVDAKETNVRLLSREVKLGQAEIRASVINESLASSPLLLHHGSIKRLNAKLRLLQIDSIAVVLEGVDLVFRPRPPDSSWWKESQKVSEDKERLNRLSQLDPEGAAIDAFAEAMEVTRASTSTMMARLTSAAFTKMRFELRDCSVRIETGVGTDMPITLGFSMRSFVMDEGSIDGGNGRGLLRAATAAFIGDEASSPVLKLCHVFGLGMWMESAQLDGAQKPTNGGQDDGTGNRDAIIYNESKEKRMEGDARRKYGEIEVEMDQTAKEGVIGSEKLKTNWEPAQRRCLLKPGDHQLLLRYFEGSVDYVEFDARAMNFQMNTEESMALIKIGGCLRGKDPSVGSLAREEDEKESRREGHGVGIQDALMTAAGVGDDVAETREEEEGDGAARWSGIGEGQKGKGGEKVEGSAQVKSEDNGQDDGGGGGGGGGGGESVNNCDSRRRAIILWQRCLSRVLAKSSKKQLARAILAGMSRRRYASLYEEWLKELRRDLMVGRVQEKEREGGSKERGLFMAVREMEKGMSYEAIALGRRVARNRSVDDISPFKLEREEGEERRTSLSPGWSLGSVTSKAAWSAIYGISALTSLRKKPVNEKRKGGDLSSAESEVGNYRKGEDDVLDTPRKVARDGSGAQSIPVLPGTEFVFVFSIQHASVAVAQTIAVSERGGSSSGNEGGAVNISCADLSLVYGSSMHTTGMEFVCGSVHGDCVSAFQTSQRTKGKDEEVKVGESREMAAERRARIERDTERWVLELDRGVPVIRSGASPTLQGVRRGSGQESGGLKEGWVWQSFKERMGLPARMAETRARSYPASSSGAQGSPNNGKSPERKEGLALAVEEKRPFLVYETESKVGWLSRDETPGGLTSCRAAVGRLDCFLSGDVVTCFTQLAGEVGVIDSWNASSPSREGSYHADEKGQAVHDKQSLVLPAVELVRQLAGSLMNSVREYVCGAVPGKPMNFSALACGFRLVLTDIVSAPGGAGRRGRLSSKKSGLSGVDEMPWQDQALIVELGQVEVGAWPVLAGSTGELSSDQAGGQGDSIWGWRSVWGTSRSMRESNAWWDRGVEGDAWRKRPIQTTMGVRDGGNASLTEYLRVWNNVRIAIKDLSIGMGEKGASNLSVLSWILCPSKLVWHSSLYRERATSILEAEEAVSLISTVRISPILVHLGVTKVAAALQIVSMLLRGYRAGLETGIAAKQFFPLYAFTKANIDRKADIKLKEENALAGAGVGAVESSTTGRNMRSEIHSSLNAAMEDENPKESDCADVRNQNFLEGKVFSILFRVHISSFGTSFLESSGTSMQGDDGRERKSERFKAKLGRLDMEPFVEGDMEVVDGGQTDRDGAFFDSVWGEVFMGDGYRAHCSFGWEGFSLVLNAGDEGRGKWSGSQGGGRKVSGRRGRENGKAAVRENKERVECSIGRCCLNLCGPEASGEMGDVFEDLARRRITNQQAERAGLVVSGDEDSGRMLPGEEDGAIGFSYEGRRTPEELFSGRDPQLIESFPPRDTMDDTNDSDFGSAAERFSVWMSERMSSRGGHMSPAEAAEFFGKSLGRKRWEDKENEKEGSPQERQTDGGSDGEAGIRDRQAVDRRGVPKRPRSLGSTRELEMLDVVKDDLQISGGRADAEEETLAKDEGQISVRKSGKRKGKSSSYNGKSIRLSPPKGGFATRSADQSTEAESWDGAALPLSPGGASFRTAEGGHFDGEMMTEMHLLKEMSTSGILWGKQWAVGSLQIGSMKSLSGGLALSDLETATEKVMTGSDEVDIILLVAEDMAKARVNAQGGLVFIDGSVLVLLAKLYGNYYNSFLQSVSGTEIWKSIFPSPPSSAGADAQATAAASSLQQQNGESWPEWQGEMSMDVSDFSVVLARRSAEDYVTGEGFLFELDSSLHVNVDHDEIFASAEVDRFAVRVLLASRKSFGQMGKLPINSQVDQSAQLDGGLVSDPREFARQSQSPVYELVDSGGGGQETNREILFEGEPRMVLDSVQMLCDIKRAICRGESCSGGMVIKRGAWDGHCAVGGLDIAITTYELQLLLAVTAPLRELSSLPSAAGARIDLQDEANGKLSHEESIPSAIPEAPTSDDDADAVPYLPHGSIVAIKDVYEQLFVAVEEHSSTLGTFSFTGVRHYSLVGERALFKVKRLKNRRHKEGPWFCLLSLYARHGLTKKALRLHYQPATGLPEIATTNDGAWEQWRLLPAKRPEYLDGVVPHNEGDESKEGKDRDNSKAKVKDATVYLENQKAGRCLSILDGSVVMGKLSHPLKIKVVALPMEGEVDPEFEMEEAEAKARKGRKKDANPEPVQDVQRSQAEEVAVAMATLPNIEVVLKHGMSVTFLYEAAGGAHMLPLVRARGEELKMAVQLGTEKTRIVAGWSIGFDYFEVEHGKWEKIVSRVALEYVYRARSMASILARQEWRTPARMYVIFRKVDIFLNEAAMDTCLFLVGMLNLAGPYTMKLSPVQANRCQVQNHTGVGLNCQLGTSQHIRPRTDQDFLIRHMPSRRDIRAALMHSTIALSLGGPTGIKSSFVSVPLTEPGVQIIPFELPDWTDKGQGSRVPAVISISKQSQEGLFVAVSPLLTIRNMSGMPILVRYWKPATSAEGAGKGTEGSMRLDNGEAVDDVMHFFDIRTRDGSPNGLMGGDCILAVKPQTSKIKVDGSGGVDPNEVLTTDWSPGISATESFIPSGFVERLQQKIKSQIDNVWGRQFSSTLGCICCPVLRKPNINTKEKVAMKSPGEIDGEKSSGASEKDVRDEAAAAQKRRQERPDDRTAFCFLLSTVMREVRVRALETTREENGVLNETDGQAKEHSWSTVRTLLSKSAQWMRQRQLLLLPTMRICNLLTTTVTVSVVRKGAKKTNLPQQSDQEGNAPATGVRRGIYGIDLVRVNADGGNACLYTKPERTSFVIHHTGLNSSSQEITLDVGGGRFGEKIALEGVDAEAALKHPGKQFKEREEREVEEEREIMFGDGRALALVRASREESGVFLVTIYAKYYILNATNIPLLCTPRREPTAQQKHQRRGLFRRSLVAKVEPDWPENDSGTIHTLAPGSRTPWLNSAHTVVLRRPEAAAKPSVLNLDSIGGLTEISLSRPLDDNLDERLTLGVQIGASQKELEQDITLSRIVRLAPRYVIVNEGNERLYVCQDGFQDDSSASVILEPGEKRPLFIRIPKLNGANAGDDTSESPRVAGRGHLRDNPAFRGSEGDARTEGDSDLRVCVRPHGSGWRWSGPVRVGAIGSFSLRIKSSALGSRDSRKRGGAASRFVVANVVDEAPSLIMRLCLQGAESAVPYRIENQLQRGTLAFAQKGSSDMEFLGPGESIGYAWDDMKLERRLVIDIPGTKLHQEVNLDKIKSRRVFRQAIFDQLLLPFRGFSYWGAKKEAPEGEPEEMEEEQDERRAISYEVYADGPTRVIRISEGQLPGRGAATSKGAGGERTRMELWLRVEMATLTLLERQRQEGFQDHILGTASLALTSSSLEAFSSAPVRFAPLLYVRILGINVESLDALECMSLELQMERIDIDVKWDGNTNPVLLRPHGRGQKHPKSSTREQSFVEMAIVISNRVTKPMLIQYASFLMRPVEINLDEETLMRLVPFKRSSLSKTSSDWNRPIFFERFEVNPIMIIASFEPRASGDDGYSSAQQALRALLHSVIKIPSVKGTTVKLNGFLLQHALLSYNQLAMKCAQHYSWYAMRAAYVARGVELLPPAFASLFDDSAAMSIDAFFDPSQGFVDAQNLALGMFSLLRNGLRRKGFGGTQRYLGELEGTVRQAGSNLLYAVVTEVSDNVLKGAEAHGIEGMLRGFRRGILSVAMRPSVLTNAVVGGSGTKKIKLDKSLGTDEVYVEGYLQAMLDVLFRQDYLRVKVSNDQVVLKNLPPNSTLSDEVVSAVRAFLVGEGLLQGQASAAAARVLRRLRGDSKESNLLRALFSMSEQLMTILAVRALKKQILRLLNIRRQEQPEYQRRSSMADAGSSTSYRGDGASVERYSSDVVKSHRGGVKNTVGNVLLSSILAYLDGRLCRNIPNPLVRRIVSGVLISLLEP